MSAKDADVVVVGAGLTGASTAWALSRDGVSVVLLEAHPFGHTLGSSHGSSRIFRRIYRDPVYLRMTGQAQQRWAQLESESGTSLLRWTGGVDHGRHRDPEGIAEFLAQQPEKVDHELLDAQEAEGRWPGMRFRGPVLFHPDAGTVDADLAVATFLAQAGGHGAHLAAETPVERIDVRGDSDVVVHAGAESVRARSVVLANGPWMPSFLAGSGLGIDLPPVRVTRQQVFHFPRVEPDTTWPVVVHKDAMQVFALPSGSDGGIRPAVKVAQHDAGPIVDPGSTGALDPAAGDRIRGYVREWMPGLEDVPVAAATCLYTTTADEDFVLDRRGPVVVASPCSGHGAKFAPLLGHLIGELARGRRQPPPRFAIDRPGRRAAPSTSSSTLA
ncbi:FAD-dependent oxidoreductase [Modestobacter lapidis]|nr:FAD-dependent oxidoreductase [Modestobacter lapidis]